MEDAEKKTPHPLWASYYNVFVKGSDESKIDTLRRIPFLHDLRKRELKIISKSVHDRTFEEGEFVFESGQPGAAMFIINEGEIKIIKKNLSDEEVELATLGPGEFFGELALLDNSPRSANALVSRPTKAIAIFREDLNNLLETHPELGGKIMKRLAINTGLRLRATSDLLIQKENELIRLKVKSNDK